MGTYYAIQSKLSGNVIDIQGASTASGAPLDAYPLKEAGDDNQLWEFVLDPAGSGYYYIKSKLNGNVIELAADEQRGATLVANPQFSSVVKFSDTSQLWQFFEDPAGSGYCFIMNASTGYVIDIAGASTKPGALLDAYAQKPTRTDNNQLWQVIGGKFPSAVKAVPDPAGGLVSNGNYFLTDYDNTLTNVSVMVTFLEDFVSTANGYSFQLNCYSKEGKNITTEWQQFVIYAEPNSTQLFARIDTWSGTALSDELNRIDVPLANLPSPTIPAGYSILFQPIYDSSNGPGTVAGCLYTVYDNSGKNLFGIGNPIGNAEIKIVGQTLRTTGKPATAANLAPIVAFQFNIGGDFGLATATLSTTSGTIAYSADNNLHAVNTEPKDTDFNDGTGETANLIFGPLPVTQATLIRQWFQAAISASPKQRIRQPRADGRPLHMLPAPDDLSRGR